MAQKVETFYRVSSIAEDTAVSLWVAEFFALLTNRAVRKVRIEMYTPARENIRISTRVAYENRHSRVKLKYSMVI